MTETRQIRLFFRQRDISTSEVARATGYSRAYVYELLAGDNLTDAARFRLLLAYPELRSLFLPQAAEETDAVAADNAAVPCAEEW